MIDIGNGHSISNIVISTAFGHSGSGMFPYILLPSYRRLMRVVRETRTTVFSKSATRFSRRGNFILGNPLTWKYIQRLPFSRTGMLNAYGLTNEGVLIETGKISLAIERGFNVIPNFFPEFSKGKEVAISETLQAMRIYSLALGSRFVAVELNYSCPNDQCGIKENMEYCYECSRLVKKNYPDIFLITKISIVHPYEFVWEQERAGVNAIHAINTIPHDIVFPGKVSPLANVGGGGVSGGPAKLRAREYNRGLRTRVSIPLIFGCGVENVNDYHYYQDIGADAVSICSLLLRDSKEAIRLIKEANG